MSYEQGNMNIEQQQGSYDVFVKLFSRTTIALVILMLLMFFTLV